MYLDRNIVKDYMNLSSEERNLLLELSFHTGYKIRKGKMVPEEIKDLTKKLGLRNLVVAC